MRPAKYLPSFTSEKERQQWMIDHADYFVLIRRANFKNHRVEYLTLKEAIGAAKGIVQLFPQARIMIYAVFNVSDTYVTTISYDILKVEEKARGNSRTRRNSPLQRGNQ